MTTIQVRREIRRLSGLVLAVGISTGVVLLLLSYVARDKKYSPYVYDLLKDLGIVIAAVCVVHFVYETLLADKYLEKFAAGLRSEVEKSETNVATCSALGIDRIFLTRDVFEQAYPLAQWLAPLQKGSQFRIIGRSIFNIMSKAQLIKEAIKRGAAVELCLLDPATQADQASRVPGMLVSDVDSALAVFNGTIASWVRLSKPEGDVQLRFHDLVLFDSYTRINGPNRDAAVWDLSFGRDLTEKRVLLLNASKPLAKDLTGRYDLIFDQAVVAFEYRAKVLITDRLPINDKPGGAGAALVQAETLANQRPA